jgi:hypothetical protein
MTTLPVGGGAVTVTDDVDDFVSAVAVMITLPAATPVTRPVCETVATDWFELDHATTAEVAGFVAAVS